MRTRLLLITALVALLALALWSKWRDKQAPTERGATVSSPVINGTLLVSPSTTTIAHPSSSAAGPSVTAKQNASRPGPFPTPEPRDLIEVDKVNLMLRDYRTIAGGNPVGTNAEIMAAVMGKNPKQAKLGPPQGMQMNENGELIDRWGTPYFFHQLSRDHMEIRSAGPDRILWTEDDPAMK